MNLTREAPLAVHVHPLVVFSILDHYNRRADTKRVLGTLLGVKSENAVEITNCFAIRHEEAADFEHVALGKKLHDQMLELTGRIHKKEVVVGWYTTTVADTPFPSNNVVVHGFYCDQTDDPVILEVDTLLRNNRMGVKAFTISPLLLDDDAVGNVLREHPVQLEMSPQERICLDNMLHGGAIMGGGGEQKGLLAFAAEGGEGACETKIDGNLAGLEGTLGTLQGLLDTVSAYVDDVVDGKREKDHAIGAAIAAGMASVPRLRPELFQRSFADNVQDLVLVDFLTSLTRAQLKVAEKLHRSL